MKWTLAVMLSTLGLVLLAAYYSDGVRGLASALVGLVFSLAVVFALALAQVADGGNVDDLGWWR